MRRIITILSVIIVIISITASFGFTIRGGRLLKTKANDAAGVYLFPDEQNFAFLVNSLLSDSTNSDSLSGEAFQDSSVTDSVITVDSMALDSTARLKYFAYKQPDYLSSRAVEPFKSKFFIYPSPTYVKKTVELDSTGQYVLIKETIAGKQTRIAVKMPLSDYIAELSKKINKKELNNLSRKYELVEGNDDLGDLLSNITNIEIPLPSTSFLSIFGPPKINLRINGSVDIHGAWRNETTEGLTASALGNTRNEPDFSQQVQISVNGTIGDKLTIGADWNTERTFEYENQLKLRYKGYEDEIIQSIEAGNVSLQTSPLVGGSEALFGVKAKFQFGPFTLTALASQKKGEVKEVSVSGGSEKQKFSIQAFNYSENNYFLDTVYASVLPQYNFFNKYFGKLTPQVDNRYFVKELEVWRSAQGNINQATQKIANVFINLDGRHPADRYDDIWRGDGNDVSGETMYRTRFEKLQEGVDYIYHEATGFVTFKTQIQRSDAIAVAYRIEGATSASEDDIIYGEFEQEIKDSIIVLKLIKPENLQPSYKQAWKLQLRNIYPLGGREISKEGFDFDIFYNIEGQEPQNNYDGKILLRQFKLDRLDESGNEKPDGKFDFRPGITIIPETGEIIFPVLEPFGRDLPAELPKDIAYYSLYDTTKTFAQNDVSKNKFLMKGEYSASVSSTFQIGFNVVENSVRVTLDGRELKNGVDYVVDYNIGQITMRNADAMVPGANLKITYEQNDLFQLASKTLLGLRGIYKFGKDTHLGFSFLNLNQKTLSDKVRIGEEPINNSIYGIDFKTKQDLPFLTTALDKVFSTSAKSSFNLTGEFAYINPDPNTKKSTVASDNGQSIAYIDDFESSKRTIPIGISYTSWKDLSVPDSLPLIGDLSKKEQMRYKGKSFWYNILPSRTYTTDIWPNKQVSTKDKDVVVLDYYYMPDEKGMYNNNPDLVGNSDKAWGGMMKSLSSTANNLVEEKIEAIEFWINIFDAPDGAVLHLDLGQISEDIIPNLKLDTEDKEPWNDIIDEGEDTGIDGLRNVDEPGYDPKNNPDPNGDDFKLISGGFLPEHFLRINGTQGNAALSDIGRFPDSEDMNGNKKLDKINNYFRYDIPLDTSIARNPYISGGGAINDKGEKSTWYQIKVPLKEYKKMIGNPTFSLVEYLRLWVSGVNSDIHFQLTEFNLVGNQWQKIVDGTHVTAEDTVLTISNVSIEENPFYYSPPGIVREKDRTNPEQNILKNEQSLDMIINNLEDGDYRTIVKYLVKGLDVFNYSAMKLFVHGDLDTSNGSISYYKNEKDYATDLYFRFGADSTNYYEYIRPTKAGWEEININFDDLTAIKASRPPELVDSVYRISVPGKPGHYYGIRGKPSLTKVAFLALGIYNPPNVGTMFQEVSGHLWVNELRVVGADETPGWATSANASIKFADILTVSGSFKQTDPYFHKLSDRFGKRVDARTWNVQGNLNILKLLPFKMPGSNLSINVSHSESISKPLYKPQTDILVEKAAESIANPDSLREETETINISNTISVSNIKLQIPSKKWYIRETINGLSFNYSFNNSYSRSPSTKFANRWGWNGSGRYSAKFSNDNFFQPANLPIIGIFFKIFKDYRNVKIYFTPQSFNANLSAKRSYSYTKSRTANVAANVSRDFTANRGFNFRWKLTEGGFLNLSSGYDLTINSSLVHLLTDENGIDRPEKDIWNDIFNGELFGRDNGYNQKISINAKPKMPSLFNLNKFFIFSAGYSVSYHWRNNFAQPDLGRSAGWSNRISGTLQVKLKSIMDPLFAFAKGSTKKKTTGRKKRTSKYSKKNIENKIKTKAEKDKEEKKRTKVVEKPSVFNSVLGIMLSSIKYVLFDYDQISFNFSQNNSQASSGLKSFGTGFWNFWGPHQDDINGPSRLYQFGFTSDPGPRASGGQLSDKFSQKNNFTIKTRRPLWKGANLDVNWDLGWGYNKSTSLEVDSLTGAITIINTTASGNLNRSFLTFPIAGASVEAINNLYDPNAPDPNKSLSEAFVQGLESLPLLANVPVLKDIAQYIPRANWRISWSGLEKLPLVKKLFKRASLTHSYTSKYTEGWKLSADGNEQIQMQKVTYGFSPLIGLNLTFVELWGGNVKGNIKYSTKKDYTLGIATKATTETFSNDMNISLSFGKSGFSLPLFGLSLKNDIEISFAYTQGRNSVLIYQMGERFDKKGKPQDGTKRVSIEPRVKYVMSSRVTLSLFFKRTSVEPEGASKIPPTTTNEAGLDVHISIQ
jgi:cell surface protein SprA